jgi:glycine/D-amino acid oxidase-like deaminating enzyme
MQISWPDSLWAADAGRADDYPPLSGDQQTEVCIVGGGFTGLSAALHLVERGHLVTLLEAQAPGWGASGRNGGQVIPGLKLDPAAIEKRYGRERGGRYAGFAGSAADIVFDLIKRYRIDCQA